MIVNILYDGMIPLVNKKGPLFGYEIADGVFSLFVKMYPYITIEIPKSRHDVETSKKKWEEDHRKVTEVTSFLHEVPGDVEEQVEVAQAVAYAEGLTDLPPQARPMTEEDLLIDLAIEEAKDAAPREVPQAVKTVIGGKYDGRPIDSLVKRECKEILESRGFKASTEAFAKSDPMAWKYRDSIEDLRRKVKATQ